MKNIIILLFLSKFGFTQIAFDSTSYWETAMWDSIAKTIERAEKEQRTYYYTVTGVQIPKTFNEPIVEVYYNKRRKIFIQKEN